MQIIQCTAKLRKEMGLSDSSLVVAQDAGQLVNAWHANLIYIAGRKCILFVNNKTRFNFIVTDVSRSNIKELRNLFVSNLYPVLAQEGFTEIERKIIAKESEDIHYSKTSSKSVLGSINDLTFHYEHSILEAGSVHSHEIPAIISRLNRMPMSVLKCVYPVEALKAEVANET